MTQQATPKMEPQVREIPNGRNLREHKHSTLPLRRKESRGYLLDLLLTREFHLATFMAWMLYRSTTIYLEDLRYVLKVARDGLLDGYIDINQN